MKAIIRIVIILSALLLLGGAVYTARGNDAFTDTTPLEEHIPDLQTPDFSEFVTENEKGESIFAVQVRAFTDYFNGVYRQSHENDYLNSTSSDNWYWYSELSPRFGYESTRYQFTADKTVWPMPTISIYASNSDEIYEIRMTFDDHGYQERFHTLFKELCICMEKTLMQGLSESEADELFEALYAQAYNNFFGNHHVYGDPERPPLTSVYRNMKIGMYCFYGAGNIEICFIPLTESAVNILNTENVKIIDYKGEQQ